MEQRCYLWSIWLTWAGLPLLGLVVALQRGLLAGVIVLAVGALAQVYYIRLFPSLSRSLGYGSVDDVPARAPVPPPAPVRVTLYTANVCPFCPILKRRLAALREQMRFEIDEVDVTFRPEIIRSKGLRSVPVLEANGRTLVGNATSEQLAAFLSQAAAAAPAAR
jgi:glutaredoxin